MRLLGDVLLSLIQLGEAEFRAVRRGVRRLIAHGVMLLVAVTIDAIKQRQFEKVR